MPWGHFLKNPRILTVLVLDFIAAINLIFMDPILVLRLQELGIDEDNAGLGFALMAGTFTIGAGISGELAEKFDKRIIICGAMFFVGAALWLAGGLYLESEALTWIGLGLNGLFVAGIFIPMIPELINSTDAWILEHRLDSSSTQSVLSQAKTEEIQ